MPRPQLILVLHAHLPWVRHPEFPRFHEESWLFEALLECYLPLCGAMTEWSAQQWPWRLALSISPTLAAALDDPLLRERFEAHFDALQDLAGREIERQHFQPEFREVAEFYAARLTELRRTWHRIGGDVLSEFARHASTGHLELFTCSATHAVLPLLKPSPQALDAQIALALATHERRFGRVPAGFWLPECAYAPEVEAALRARGVQWTILETHGLLQATPRPQAAVFAPVITPGGLVVFGRDPASARQVWSRDGGYPGDPRYREFHRDLSQDAEREYLRHWQTGEDTEPTFTGLKYHAVTGTGDQKAVYQRSAALAAVRDHAAHFVQTRAAWARRAVAEAPLPEDRPVVCVAPYDAELFGHWWFEGPEFLSEVVRLVSAPDSPVELTTPSEHLRAYPRCECVQPNTSSWGEGGHLRAWLDVRNAWMQAPLRAAEEMMQQLARRYRDGDRPRLAPDANFERALRQAARELLLAQASDWPFLLRHGTAGDYPRRRFTEHLAAFHQLAQMLQGLPPWDAALLRDREFRHPLFPDVDWRLWA